MIDRKYEQARNALIPEAERHAFKVAGAKPAMQSDGLDNLHNRWASAWNRAFFAKMDELAKAAGLVKDPDPV